MPSVPPHTVTSNSGCSESSEVASDTKVGILGVSLLLILSQMESVRRKPVAHAYAQGFKNPVVYEHSFPLYNLQPSKCAHGT